MLVTSLVIKDNGRLKRIVAAARGYRAKVKVGYFGNTQHSGKRPITLGNLARIHEFGTKHIPKRTFIAPALKQNSDKYARLATTNFERVSQTGNTHTLWQLVGQVAVGDVQSHMTDGKFTPLSQKTIKQKGSSKPLIDTEQLRQSVTYQVNK